MNLEKSLIYRFDLMAKYLYIYAKDKNLKTKFFKELYQKHIKTFNNCYEHPGTKNNIDEFINEFDKLITSIKNDGFDSNYPIKIGINDVIVNGAHRLMSSYYYNKTPIFSRKNEMGNENYNYNFFLNRKINPPLQQLYTDTMALECIKHNSNLRCMIVYPIAFQYNKFEQLIRLINNYGNIYYSKSINLTHKGINNLVKELYREEKWIGGLFPKGWSPGGKAQRCVARQVYPTMFILIHMKDLLKCDELKEHCRGLFNIGKHSLHISDFKKDTFRIASSLLNENSIHFLNNGTNDISLNTKNLLTNYFNKLGENNEDFCLTSSLIMEMYGLRQANDIDYLHKNNMEINLKDIGLHNGKWENYYNVHKDEIIYNPKNHFYFNGFKFANLDIIKKMKENRREPKDISDIKMINEI